MLSRSRVLFILLSAAIATYSLSCAAAAPFVPVAENMQLSTFQQYVDALDHSMEHNCHEAFAQALQQLGDYSTLPDEFYAQTTIRKSLWIAINHTDLFYLDMLVERAPDLIQRILSLIVQDADCGISQSFLSGLIDELVPAPILHKIFSTYPSFPVQLIGDYKIEGESSTIFTRAAYAGHIDLVLSLLDPNAPQTSITSAALITHLIELEIGDRKLHRLLTAIAQTHPHFLQTSSSTAAPSLLDHVVAACYHQSAQLLKTLGCDFSPLADGNICRPLVNLAHSQQNAEALKLFLKLTESLNNEELDCIFACGVAAGDCELLDLVVHHGFNTHIFKKPLMTLKQAAGDLSGRSLEWLIKHGLRVNWIYHNGRTLWHELVEKRNLLGLAVLKTLPLEQRPPINSVYVQGLTSDSSEIVLETPLHRAVAMIDPSLCTSLLDGGADPDFQEQDFMFSPLAEARHQLHMTMDWLKSEDSKRLAKIIEKLEKASAQPGERWSKTDAFAYAQQAVQDFVLPPSSADRVFALINKHNDQIFRSNQGQCHREKFKSIVTALCVQLHKHGRHSPEPIVDVTGNGHFLTQSSWLESVLRDTLSETFPDMTLLDQPLYVTGFISYLKRHGIFTNSTLSKKHAAVHELTGIDIVTQDSLPLTASQSLNFCEYIVGTKTAHHILHRAGKEKFDLEGLKHIICRHLEKTMKRHARQS